MIIRKEYSVESAHIVRNCSSERCAHSIHGHSAKIEVLLRGGLDNAGMVYDFGLMKSTIKEFIDSMDHCTLFWDRDDDAYIQSIKKHSDRWISLPFNPTAENLAVFVGIAVDHILQHTEFQNGEHSVKVHGVRYHETATGYAEAESRDIETTKIVGWLDRTKYSEAVWKDWSANLRKILNGSTISNPLPFKQV